MQNKIPCELKQKTNFFCKNMFKKTVFIFFFKLTENILLATIIRKMLEKIFNCNLKL